MEFPDEGFTLQVVKNYLTSDVSKFFVTRPLYLESLILGFNTSCKCQDLRKHFVCWRQPQSDTASNVPFVVGSILRWYYPSKCHNQGRMCDKTVCGERVYSFLYAKKVLLQNPRFSIARVKLQVSSIKAMVHPTTIL